MDEFAEPETEQTGETCYRHTDRLATHQLHKPVGDPPDLVPTVKLCQEDADELTAADPEAAATQITVL